MIRVTLQKGTAEDIFAEIKVEWGQLFSSVVCSPFSSWEWLSVWHKNFGKTATAFILKAYRDDKLIGILPMVTEKGRFLGMKFKRLRLMGDGPGGADHLDLIGKPEDKAETLTAIYSFIQSGRYCDEIRFENVIGNSTTVDLFRNFSSIKNSLFPRSSISVTSVCPQIDLSGGWDTLLQKCKRRNEFIRKLRKLERFPDFEYRSVISPDETGAAFERFLCLHNSGWQGRGGSDLTGHPRLVSFQRQLVREISRVGLVRFEELWVDGECRCSIYGLDDGNTFYNYNTGYDRDYSHLSVGLILLGLSIKNSIERCNTTYDFLRGDETYKSDWANRRSDISTVCLSRNTVPAIAYEQMGKARDGFRDYSKSALPAAITESLAAYRRTRKRNHLLSGR